MAGGKDVSIASPAITQQYLNAGLLDEIVVELVPVLMGEGIRFFDHLAAAPIRLTDPDVIQGTGVTYLPEQVLRS